jgi:TPR repeat protein
MTNEDIYACAMDALSDHHYAVALKWFRMGAGRGDYYSQVELGTMYEDGSGVTTDFVQAYEWFEIAAATHEACKDQRPPRVLPETSRVEIRYRDGVAKQMNRAQIETAQRLAHKWKPSGQAWKWDAPHASYVKAQSGC